MINLSSFIAFHAKRTPHRTALKYRGEDISYTTFDARIGKVAGKVGLNINDAVVLVDMNAVVCAQQVLFIVLCR